MKLILFHSNFVMIIVNVPIESPTPFSMHWSIADQNLFEILRPHQQVVKTTATIDPLLNSCIDFVDDQQKRMI